MKVPGPKVTYTLQEPTESRTSGGGVTNTWSDLTTFRGSLGPLTAQEIAALGTEIEVSTHRAIIGYEEVDDTYATSLKPKNRLYLANTNNQLAAETFDITGAQPFRYPGNEIATFEVMLRKVD